jgi:hypothetical protein
VATSQQPARPGRPARPAEPVLITAAEPGLDEQHAARKKRYAITMGVRAVAITLAAVVYQYALWLAILLAILGTVLPWIAVVMANDGPPKKRVRVNHFDARPDRVLESRPTRVIDG